MSFAAESLSLRNSTPQRTLVMGSNRESMDAVVGPTRRTPSWNRTHAPTVMPKAVKA